MPQPPETASAPAHEEVLAMLRASGLLGGPVVDVVETHAARVYIGSELALKIKRPVRFDYLDFSQLAKRNAACRREIELNQPQAPEIYLRRLALVRRPSGELAAVEADSGDAAGAVEWGVLMRRFEPGDLLALQIEAGPLPGPMLDELAAAIVRAHGAAPIVNDSDGPGALAAIAAELGHALAKAPEVAAAPDLARWRAALAETLARHGGLAAARARAGFVRRCHGDLHLGNIVLWHGRPVLFDALEFDERLAITDTLYDLAFLLMDLDVRGHRRDANIVLNRYLWRRDEPADLDGLALMPLLLGLRAGIRAMVGAQRAAQGHGEAAAAARVYFAAAVGYLRLEPARLVAIGGLSGSGKSTLAQALAPELGAAPGAVLLRSDLERKAMLGVGETERLPADAYTKAASDAVYGRLLERAERALVAGRAVVLDAVWLDDGERAQAAALAQRLGVPFHGLWLDAPLDVLLARVTARRGDASDATREVVAWQWARSRQPGGPAVAASSPGDVWRSIDAAGAPTVTLAASRRVLGLDG